MGNLHNCWRCDRLSPVLYIATYYKETTLCAPNACPHCVMDLWLTGHAVWLQVRGEPSACVRIPEGFPPRSRL